MKPANGITTKKKLQQGNLLGLGGGIKFVFHQLKKTACSYHVGATTVDAQ